MAFCPNCGTPVEGRFCANCGATVDPHAAGAAAPGAGASYSTPPAGAYTAPPPSGAAYPPPPGSAYVPPAGGPAVGAAGMTENMASALCYLLGLVTGILFLVIAPYNQNRNVRFHAFQSIFMHVGLIAVWIVLTILSFAMHAIPFIGSLFSLLLYMVIGFGGFLLWVYMLFKTYNGEKVVLPVVGELAEKQANA